MYRIDENGDEILYTKDHIKPKSRGGKNNIINYQTMCYNCNLKKGDKFSIRDRINLLKNYIFYYKEKMLKYIIIIYFNIFKIKN